MTALSVPKKNHLTSWLQQEWQKEMLHLEGSKRQGQTRPRELPANFTFGTSGVKSESYKTNSDSCNGQSLWLTTNGRGWLINLQIIYFLYFCIKMCIETGHLYLNWCLWNIILLGRFNYFKNINFKSFSKLTLNYYIDFKIYTQHYVSLKLSQ